MKIPVKNITGKEEELLIFQTVKLKKCGSIIKIYVDRQAGMRGLERMLWHLRASRSERTCYS